MSEPHDLASAAAEPDPTATWDVMLPWIVQNIGTCRGCHQEVAWCEHERTRGRAPFNRDGTSHFATCPNAAQFRRRR